MRDAMLRLLDGLRDVDERGHPTAEALRAFVHLVAGRPSTDESEWWIDDVVGEALDRPARSRADAFRAVFELTRDLPVPTTRGDASSGSLALEGLLSLGIRERVTLALSCVTGLTLGEVAWVIDEDHETARALLEKAVAEIRRGSGRAAGIWFAA